MANADLGEDQSTDNTVSVTEQRALRSQPWLALSVLMVLVAAAVVTSFLTRQVIHDQERQLLGERVNDIQALLDARFLQSQSSIESITAAVSGAIDPTRAFRRTASPLVERGDYAYVSLVDVRSGTMVVADAVGSGWPIETQLTAEPAAATRDAMAHPGLLSTTGVMTIGEERRIGGAVYLPETSHDHVVYLEARLAAIGENVERNASAPFEGVQATLFAGTIEDPKQVVFMVGKLPTHEPRVSRVTRIGVDDYLLVANARASLIGWLAAALPTIVLLSGLIAGALTATIIGVLQRRREYAIALVDARTRALAHSMEVLRERARLDALLRQASRDIANAPDLNSAVASLYAIVGEIVPVDRLVLAVIDETQLSVVAVAGPQSAGIYSGLTISLDDERLARVLETQAATILPSSDDRPFPLGMTSTMAIALFAEGQPQALIALASQTPDAYRPDHIAIVEAIGRETSGVINQLLLHRRERETARRFQELDQLKSEFVGIVAHDLRSPMTVIAGFADLLRKNRDQLSDEESQDYLERISVNIKRLAELVEDVLQVARIESGELTCENRPFNLPSLVRRTVGEIADAHGGRPYTISIREGLPTALADEQRQWQILTNLVTNAFKFSPKELPVEVSVARVGDHLVISVRDHGIGIHQDDLPRIFQKFSRVPQPGGGKVTGTGLGLYIARSLVEAQGGNIEVESTAGEGSTFRYTVPVAESEPTHD